MTEQQSCPVCKGRGLNPLTEVPVACANCHRVTPAEPSPNAYSQVAGDKHWKSHLYGGSIESHTEFMLRGHKRILKSHPSKKALQNHIERLSIEAQAVTELLEALEQVIKAAPSSGPLWHGSEQIVEARKVLAAYRQGGGQ